MIDFHAHILPGADHGSDSVETSIEQIMRAKKSGFSTIIATPHFYEDSDTVEEFVSRRKKSYDILTSALNERDIDIKIIPACELNLQIDLFKMRDLSPFCIGNTNYILVEMPLDLAWTNWHYDAIDELIALGFEPIIAHINRYPTKYLEKLFSKNILYQVNIEAFHKFSSRMKVLKQFRCGNVQFIGSDIHNISSVYSDFTKYKRKYPKLFNECNRNAKKILNYSLK